MSPAASAPENSGRYDARVEVWHAFSDLYLDTDIVAFYPHIAEVLAKSPYSLDALYEILMYDVHPALYPNLTIVAGEWAGFDREWLCTRITQVRTQPRWLRRFSHLFVREIRDDWRKVAERVVDLRAGSTDAQMTSTKTTNAQAPHA
jgi:hypothetical protein